MKADRGSELQISLDLDYLPELPKNKQVGIGCVGAGFIMADCHLVAYGNAGFNPLQPARTGASPPPCIFDSVGVVARGDIKYPGGCPPMATFLAVIYFFCRLPPRGTAI